MGLFSSPKDPEKRKKSRGSWLMALLVGGAVGSVVSLLFAPDKGGATRKKAAEGSKKVWTEIKKVLDEWGE